MTRSLDCLLESDFSLQMKANTTAAAAVETVAVEESDEIGDEWVVVDGEEAAADFDA